MDNRTTIKVSKETKKLFDMIHKETRMKNHDYTLELIIRKAAPELNMTPAKIKEVRDNG